MPGFGRRISVLDAVQIIFGPAKRPLMQIFSAFGIVATLPAVLIMPFVEPLSMRNVPYLMARQQLEKLNEALQRYRADCGRYPSAREGLSALVHGDDVDGWRGPYFPKEPVDPWGKSFLYDPSTDPPTIISYGADRRKGGTLFNADLSSSNLNEPLQEIEVHEEHLRWLYWIGTIIVFTASVYTLGRCSRVH